MDINKNCNGLALKFYPSKKTKKTKVIHDYKPASFSEVLRYADMRDRLLLAVGIPCAVLTGMIRPCFLFIFRGITDVLMDSEDLYQRGHLDVDVFTERMTPYIVYYFVFGSLLFLMMLISMLCMFTLCERQVHKIRQKFFEAIMNQNMEYFDRNEVGALTQKMSSSIDKIKSGLSDKIVIIIQGVSALLTGVIIGFGMSWKIATLMCFIAPFIFLSIFGSVTAIRNSLRIESSSYSTAGAVAEEVLSGFRTVASFNAQFFEIDRYKNCLITGRKMGISKSIAIAFFSGLYMFILFQSMGFAFWYGSHLAFNNEISPGTVFAVFWAIWVGAMQMGEAIPQINSVMAGKMAAGEIFSIIDCTPFPDCNSDAGIRLSKVEGKLEFLNIHFSYPTRPNIKILRDISFTVEAGQSVALVGHSGCGKSTIFSFLMRFYELESGSVTLDDIPIQDFNLQWLRNTIGIVSQEPVIFATTVENNLRMGKEDATIEEMVDACKMANAYEFITNFQNGFKTVIGEGGIKLSGGQKQRLAIARALIRKPKILLLDEATSALDNESERIVQQAIDKASAGRTTITIAHRLSTIRSVDKIIVFDHGKIVETGTHEELMATNDGIYKQLVAAQEISSLKETECRVPNLEESQLRRRSSLRRDSEFSESRMSRYSEQLRRSMSSIKASETELDNIAEELEEVGAKPASALQILQFAKPERVMIILGFLCSLITGGTWPAFSVIYGRVFKTLSEGLRASADYKTEISFTSFLIAYGLLGVMAGIFTFLSGSILSIVGENLTMRMRLLVFENLLRQDAEFFDKPQNSIGKLTMRLAVDAPNVQAAIDQRLAGVLQGITSLFVGIIIAFYFGWNVAPFCLFSALILVVVQSFVSNYLKRRGIKDAESAEEASKIATESIGYIRTVQAIGRQKLLYNKFCKSTIIPHNRAVLRGIWQSVEYAITISFVSFNFAVAYAISTFMISHNYTTPFVVFQVIEALNVAAFTVIRTATYFPEYLCAKLSAGIIFSMMTQKPKIDNLSDVGKKPDIKGSIEGSEIYFAYPNAQYQLVLNKFSFKAPVGSTIALVGPSGCGKSTIIQLIERFYDVLSGSLLVDGVNMHNINIRHLRNSIALVGQEPTLFNLTIRDNIAYGLKDVSDEEIESAAKMANIHTFIDSLPQKYNTFAGSKGTQLSGGQKQRLAIARAIIRNPKILLLDEATSALDTESEKVVQEALDRASAGRTCITIAHRLSTTQRADLIIVVRDGRIIESGNHQELLMHRGLYHRLVEGV